MFIRIGGVFKSMPPRAKSASPMFALQIRQAAKGSIATICVDLPKEVLDTIKITTFKNGVLTIVAPSLISAELHTRSGGLKKDINRVLGRQIVRRLRFRVGIVK